MPENMDISHQALVEAALAVRETAYAPYSHFRVGAALVDDHGRIFTGCKHRECFVRGDLLCRADSHFQSGI